MLILAYIVLPAFEFTYAYIIMPLFLLIFFFINLYTRKLPSISFTTSKIICCIYYYSLFIIFILMDVVSFPNQTALWAPLLMMAFPIVYIDRLYKLCIHETVFLFIYAFFAYIFEPTKIFQRDLFNIIAAYVFSTFCSRMLLDVRSNEALTKLKLKHISTYDSLTHVLNKGAFLNLVNNFLSTNSNKPRALCIIDLDDFKHVNDNLGHNIGDKVLETVGNLLISHSDKDDFIGRFGGDEFMMLITHPQDIDLLRLICRNIQMFVTDYSIDNLYAFSLSIGAVLDYNSSSLDELINIADDALYKSKLLGKNCCTAWEIDSTSDYSKPVILHASSDSFNNYSDNLAFDFSGHLYVRNNCPDIYIEYLSQFRDNISVLLLDFDCTNPDSTFFLRYIKSREKFKLIPFIIIVNDESSYAMANAFGFSNIISNNSGYTTLSASLSKYIKKSSL
ncbi:MAG: GGDEF domain-containing protein [Butyrivibrio sp.]|nr:GGDEF domain-containing protein [Butyrivibrio sp.]